MTRICVLVTVAIVVTGCGGESTAGAGSPARDSAGVRIIESARPVWAGTEAWTLSAEPRVQIGTADGAPEYGLFEVADAIRLSDGRIVVANRGTHDVRVYSGAGRHLVTIGREGEGPGEFRYPRRVFRATDDSIVVVDFNRVSVFDEDGTFVTASPYPPPTPLARFSDGAFLQAVTARQEGGDEGPVRYLMALVRRGLEDSTTTDTLARVWGSQRWLVRVGDRIASYPAPFGRELSVAVDGRHVYAGDGANFEVAAFDLEGNLARLIRRTGVDLRIRDADVEGYESDRLQRMGTDRRREVLRGMFRKWSYPATHPAYEEVLVDRPGNLWVRHYGIGADAPVAWSLFDSTGVWLGEVVTPTGLRVTEVGRDYVLGVAVDDLGVEYVRLYAFAAER